MLIMKCSHCEKYIRSELLVELKTIRCEHCGTEVAVNNILVSSNGFTFDRDDLLKRFYRYRKLLDEVMDERSSMEENRQASAESKRSIEQFLTILQGMMTGARDQFRCLFDQTAVATLTYNGHKCHANFVNLSMDGACFEIAASQPLPRVSNSLVLDFTLPGSHQQFRPRGEICWVEKGGNSVGEKHRIGVRFAGLDTATREVLWTFIRNQADRQTTG